MVLSWTLSAFVVVLTGAAGVVDLTPRVVKTETFSETFTAIADLPGGVYLQVQLSVTNIGPGDKKGICRVLLSSPGAKPWSAARTVGSREWHALGAPRPELKVGSCSLSVGETVSLDASVDGGSVLATFQTTPRPVAAPHTPMRGEDADAFYEAEILVPWAPVTVSFARPNDKSTTLRGHGYMDHSRSTMLPGSLARGWVRFRGLNTGCSQLFLARFPLGSVQPPEGYAWTEGTGAPKPLPGLTVTLPRLGQPTGAQFSGTLGPEPGGAFRVDIGPKLYRHAPLEEYGFMGSLIGKVVGKTVTETYRATWHAAGRCERVPGILEIAHIGD